MSTISDTRDTSIRVPSDARANAHFLGICLFFAGLALGLVVACVPNPWMRLWTIGVAYVTGIGSIVLFLACLEVIRQRHASRSKGIDARSPLRRLTEIGIAFLALVTVVTSMTVFKTTIVGAAGYHWDLTFAAADRAIFGTDPWRISHAVFDQSWMTDVLDRLYHPLFMPMVLGYILCLVLPGHPALRRTYMGSYLVAWVLIGMALAWAFSSAGPVYEEILWGDGTTYAALVERLAAQEAETRPLYALRAQAYLLAAQQNGLSQFGGGISAMPSMHVVLAALWAFAGWHLSRVLGAVLTVYTALIWVGSVHLGWNYAVDGIVSLAVLAAIWWSVGRLVGLYPIGPRTPPV